MLDEEQICKIYLQKFQIQNNIYIQQKTYNINLTQNKRNFRSKKKHKDNQHYIEQKIYNLICKCSLHLHDLYYVLPTYVYASTLLKIVSKSNSLLTCKRKTLKQFIENKFKFIET